MRKSRLATGCIRVFAALSIAFAGNVGTMSSAFSTPGALRANGCHKNHCHGRGEAKQMSNGRYYIPCSYCGSKSKKKRRK